MKFAWPTLVLALAAALLALAQAQSPFPHRLHLEDEGLKCGDCHAGAQASTQAADRLEPGPEACLYCHEADQIPSSWPTAEREYRFSHQYHLQQFDLECSQCHGGIGKEGIGARTLPLMDECLTCHNGKVAPRDCEACHTLERRRLRPPTHQMDWEREHGRVARLADRSCFPCHTIDNCQECHEGGILLEGPSPGERQTSFGAELEGSAGLILQRVHGLNYRFLHASEARGKRSDCFVCHETEDFCADCHHPTRDLGVRPVWHGGPAWLTRGVGSGGGRHAELARRDLESCAACHEVQGDDPTCLLCHLDRTPGLGNDPKTHSSSFARDLGEGDFHDDDGAVCYTCHRRGRVSGEGFCGYCHRGKEEEGGEEDED